MREVIVYVIVYVNLTFDRCPSDPADELERMDPNRR
jgi:hypothetical protein